MGRPNSGCYHPGLPVFVPHTSKVVVFVVDRQVQVGYLLWKANAAQDATHTGTDTYHL